MSDARSDELGQLLTRAGIGDGEITKIQLCAALIRAGVSFEAEHQLTAHADGARADCFRADIVILQDFVPILAIEAKAYNSGQLGGKRQRQNYARCGIPALHVGPQTVAQVAEAIVRFVAGDPTRIKRFLVTDSDAKSMGGRGAALINPGTTPTALTPQEGSEPTSRSDVSTGGKTWLSEYMRVYARCYGENPSPVAVKRMARTFKQLEVVYPRADVVRRFENYLANTTIRYYSVERFADTYAGWNLHRREGGDRRLDQRPGESVDAYAARVLNG